MTKYLLFSLAGTICGSDDNHEAARQKGVDLIAPAPDRQKDLFCTLTDFEFSDNGFVISCPENRRPVKNIKEKRWICHGFFLTGMLHLPESWSLPCQAG
jgi:hypothetical protein